MSYASFPPRPRRALVLGAVIVLLHVLALRWLGTQIDAPRGHPAARETMTVLARLLAPEPKPALAPPPAPPKLPRPRPVPKRQARPPPVPPAPPPVPAAQEPADAVAAAPASDDGAAGEEGQGTPQRGAAEAAPVVQSAQQAEPAPAPAAPAAPEPRRYRVDIPPSADITLDVARVDADGTRWNGEALLSWKRNGDSYNIRVEAGIRVVFARVNLVVLTSEGAVTDAGLAPVTMTEKRRGRALTATHFNRQDGRITFSASQAAYPLAAGAQDKASVPLQLAAIARADPGQLAGDIEILVGEDRDASVFRFVVLGQEQLDTRYGKLQAWHLSRPPKPGSYNSRLDIWLAPERGWYPVQIRNTEASGAVTTQTVNNIVMTDTGS